MSAEIHSENNNEEQQEQVRQEGIHSEKNDEEQQEQVRQEGIHSEKNDEEQQESNDNNDEEQQEQVRQEGIHFENNDEEQQESNDNNDEEQQEQVRQEGLTEIERQWANYIQEDPHCPSLRNRLQSDVSIFMVPKFLKATKMEAYVPQRVSLGPYHSEYPSMDHHKGRALRRMTKRFLSNRNFPVTRSMDFAHDARTEMLQLENDVRNSYEENIDCNGEMVALKLCLDGCFLIEVLRTQARVSEADKCYDPIFGKNKLDYAAQDVRSDLLILENQIPFIVLLKLLQLELNADFDAREKLFDLAKGISSFFIPFGNTNLDVDELSSCHHHHLLDFLHAAIASPPSSSQGTRVDQGCSISIRCCSRQYILMLHGKSKERNHSERIAHAVELRNAGIKFSPLQGGCINQIKFDENSATIFLPPVSIMDHTERIFRNLIAYETCKPSEINYVTCYVALMHNLIDSEQDVALLRRMGVMSNWLGSDKEVVDLFNGLCKGVALDLKHVFDDLTEKVNAHYNNKRKVQIGKLVKDLFSSPWKALALTAAIVILLLTALQTIFTIILTYKV